LLRAWIQQSASSTTETVAGISIADRSDEPPQPVGDYTPLMSDIRRMQQGQGAKLVGISSVPSDGLVLNTLDVSASFNDTQLAQLQRFAPYIVEANLARTAITDASFSTLAKFTQLRALHLEGTAITGKDLAKLTALSKLNYLNLSETKVTAAAVAPLRSMPSLHHLYLFDTSAQALPPAGTADLPRPTSQSVQ